MTLRRLLPISALLAAVIASGTACGRSPGPAQGGPSARAQIVVTFPVLGAVVREVVGDRADVTVMMPNGTDPHEWRPSGQDIQTMLGADLVVANGLGLEGNLQAPLREAAASNVAVFTASDHVTVRKVRAGEGAGPGAPDQAPGADDPHLWLDPATMKQWVAPLASALKSAGVDATQDAARVSAGLDALDGEIAHILQAVPSAKRKLVTGHESLGYLAERYGYQLVGAVVPSVSSQAGTSAGELAELVRKVKAAGVPAVFTETGTPRATVDAVARDTGARVVELSTHTLPADGSYRTFMLGIANTIAGALR